VTCELDQRALSECLHAELPEHLVRTAELFACVETPALPTQPLAVEQLGALDLEDYAFS
jgi:hypothetical protein